MIPGVTIEVKYYSSASGRFSILRLNEKHETFENLFDS